VNGLEELEEMGSIDQLKEPAELQAQGALTEEESAAQKADLLGS
jgi:hypothetical protein